jgi:spore germination protein YaaH
VTASPRIPVAAAGLPGPLVSRLIRLAFAGAVALALVPAAGAHSPAPPGPLQAFLLAGAPDSFADLQAHPQAVGVVYPTYFECASSGALTGAPNAAVDAYAAAHGIADLPRFTCQQGALVHRILTQPALRARTLTQLVTLAAHPSYAGLDLDLENDGSADRGALSLFVQALAHGLHAEHRRLAVDVVGVTGEPVPRPAAGFYNYRALSANADTVFVMAWGVHWEDSGPGPIAPLSFAQGVARYVASLPYARRFVLGAPMYGLDWSLDGAPAHRATALQYDDAVALARVVGATPVRDPSSGELTFAYTRAGVSHRVWYLDAHAILDHVAIARRYGLAAGVWRLGEEDPALWSSNSL